MSSQQSCTANFVEQVVEQVRSGFKEKRPGLMDAVEKVWLAYEKTSTSEKEHDFGEFVDAYNACEMRLELLWCLAAILFGVADGNKRIQGAIPFEIRQQAAARAQAADIDSHTKEFVIRAYLGEHADVFLAHA